MPGLSKTEMRQINGTVEKKDAYLESPKITPFLTQPGLTVPKWFEDWRPAVPFFNMQGTNSVVPFHRGTGAGAYVMTLMLRPGAAQVIGLPGPAVSSESGWRGTESKVPIPLGTTKAVKSLTDLPRVEELAREAFIGISPVAVPTDDSDRAKSDARTILNAERDVYFKSLQRRKL